MYKCVKRRHLSEITPPNDDVGAQETVIMF